MSRSLPLAASARTLEQRMAALATANEIRFYRAQLKRDIAIGEVDALAILRRPNQKVQTMKIWDLLRAIPGVGVTKSSAALRKAGVSPSKTLGGLTARQRRELAIHVRPRFGLVAQRQERLERERRAV
jgi:hypothetical protein